MTPINLGDIGGIGPCFARKHARTTDPSTSKAAADNAKRFARGHFARILHGLRNGPYTAKELYAATGLTSVQISRRMGDLVAANAVRITGVERDGCMEYALVYSLKLL